MISDLFFGQFDLLLATPNGISRLRKLIVQLAVQGKLIRQNPNDEPASVLMRHIRGHGRKYEINNKTQKLTQQKSAVENEKPFTVPTGWEWAKLGDLCTRIVDGTHKTPTYRESGTPFVSVKEISKGYIDLSNVKFISADEHQQLTKRCNPELFDILITKVGTIGRAVVIKDQLPFSLFVNVALLKPYKKYLVSDFIAFALENRIQSIDLAQEIKGGVQRYISLRDLSEILMPVPPLHEQHRIVAKVLKLMAICEELEVKQQKKERGGIRLGAATLTALENATNIADLTRFWSLVHQNFDSLFDFQENIAKLRETLLRLATHGKLGPQNPGDESADALLERIKQDPHSLKREIGRKFEPLDLSGKPILPEGWIWVRLGEICKTSSGGTPSRTQSNYYSGNIPWLKSGELNNDIIQSAEESITEEGLRNSSTRIIKSGTVLIALYGATVGKLGILGVDAAINQAICAIYTPSGLNRDFLFWFLAAHRNELLRTRKGGAQPNITQQIINDIALPLPPYNEQRRIVAKIEHLMILCDKLEDALKRSQEISSSFADSITKAVIA